MARCLTLLVLAALWLPATAPAAGPAATRAVVERQVLAAGGASGGFAVDLDSGRELSSVRADSPRVPASVEKLYTTSTALLRLGPSARIETSVMAEQPLLPDGIVEGDLYLRGGGDPTLDREGLETLAADLVAGGLLRITGRVVGDESAFDARRGPPSSFFRTSAYVGPLGALTYNRGLTGLRAPYFQVSPARFAADAFARILRAEGVRVPRTGRMGTAPEFAASLATWQSPRVAELARRTNAPSDNFMAETLLKLLGVSDGRPGTTAAGAAVVRSTMARLGIRPRVVDGSGLSRSNQTTPRQVVKLLRTMADDDVFPAFRSSLAIAGRTGTLHDRMRGSVARGRCRAKTGTLISVSALAGYCETRGGSLVAFAFLMNAVNPYGARQLQDRALDALARYSPGS